MTPVGRFGVLYALDRAELDRLLARPAEERYEYMLEELEPALLGTPRGCELDKAWEGLQYCFGGGEWSEADAVPTNVIFGGALLADTEAEIISLKSPQAVAEIAAYLRDHDLPALIRRVFPEIDPDEYSLPKDEAGLRYLLSWGEALLPFYEAAAREGRWVIFTVNL